MKEVFVNNSINYLVKNNACSKEQMNVFRYTLESLYSLVTKTSAVLLLSILLGTFKITILSLFLYGVLRGFTFGIHASKNLYCWITTLCVYIVFPFIIKTFVFPNQILIVLDTIAILAILLWAPADTPARPLLNKKKRVMNKVISFVLSTSILLLSLFIRNQDFNEIVSFVLLLNMVCICPLTYRLFHIQYNNYKYYHK